MIVVLMGYMGSGKSYIGRQLAQKLDYEFCDLDNYIAQQENRSITELFKSKGEIYFRKREMVYLQDLLERKTNLVLALGGGTPCYGSNLDRILQNTQCVSLYLKTSIDVLVNRLFDERSERPLIAMISDKESLTEYVGKHLFERVPFYNQAQHTIECSNKTADEILEAIILQLF